MNFAYADPPYLGQGKKHYAKHHPEASVWDSPEAHQELVTRLVDEFPDGWAMSLSSPSLHTILPMCPSDVRVMAWVKPFASFKPGVNPAYAWEPVIVRGGRSAKERGGKNVRTVRDWAKTTDLGPGEADFVSANITLKKGLTGAKPPAFCEWLFEVLGASAEDTLTDLFPGTGIVTRCWDEWVSFKRAA